MKRIGLLAALLLAFVSAGSQDTGSIDSLLRRIYEYDQGVRQKIHLASGGVSQDSLRTIFKQMTEVDRKNQEIVFKIIEERGWPEGLSPDANTAIFLVIDHADLPDQQKYLSLVSEQADKGTIDVSLYATLYDRVLMKSGERQVYGTQTINFFDRSQGIQLFYMWPIEDSANVDVRRGEVNLPPLEDYLKMFKNQEIIWDSSISIEELQAKMRS